MRVACDVVGGTRPRVAALCLTRRAFSLMGRLSDAVSRTVARLTVPEVIGEDRLVTAPRHAVPKMRAASTSLAERLRRQREVQHLLVPTAITVDKTRQYIEFAWPIAALTAVQSSSFASTMPSMAAPSNAESSDEAKTGSKEGEEQTAGAAHASATPTPTPPPPAPALQPPQPIAAGMTSHRTHALAEYLRVHTMSTDGAMDSPSLVVYGRRGITITDVVPVGNYGLRLVFSDGHDGGIYSYDYLYYLTSPENKYGLMRDYIRRLKERRKSRDPPRRAPSRRRMQQQP